MSLAPTIGGKLREETSGVDRSQAGSDWWGLDPVKEIGQTCGLNVILRRLATSHRSVVTAAKLVYSTWKFIRPGKGNGKTVYRNRPASQSVYLLHSLGERQDLHKRMGAGRSVSVCEEAAAQRRSRGGDHLQYAFVSRCRRAAGGARGGRGHQSVPSDQPIGEEDRSARCPAAVAVSLEGLAAGGAHEG